MELKLPAYSYYYIYNTKNARKRLLFFQPRHRHQRMGSWHPHGSGSRSDTALVYRSFYISSHRYACFRGHPIVTETFHRYVNKHVIREQASYSCHLRSWELRQTDTLCFICSCCSILLFRDVWIRWLKFRRYHVRVSHGCLDINKKINYRIRQ